MSLQAVKNRDARTAVDRVLRVCARVCARAACMCLYIFIAFVCVCVQLTTDGPEMATRNELQVNVSINTCF